MLAEEASGEGHTPVTQLLSFTYTSCV